MSNTIKGVEIFAAGKWNGDEFTIEDLDGMIAAFNENKTTLPPYLKLGHDDEQKLLQADGLPAAGWVENVYRKGDKLFADFRDIPDKVYQLIDKGAYRKVSIELYHGLEIMKKKVKNFISAVSLLGADMPAVQNLGDILARYGLKDYDKKIKAFTDDAVSAKIYHYELNKKQNKGGRMPTLEQEIAEKNVELKALQEKLAKAETEASKFKAETQESKKKIEDIEKALDETRKEFKTAAEQLKQAEIDKQVAELESAKLISPAMKPFVKNLLDSDKKEYSIKLKDDEKTFSRYDLTKEILKLAQGSAVNFDDNSADVEGEPSTFSQKAMDDKIKKYMADNKCDYATAYKAVMKDK